MKMDGTHKCVGNTLPTYSFVYNLFRIAIMLIISFLLLQKVQAQKFTIELSKEKIRNSLYNQIGLYNARRDTMNFGMVDISMLNEAAYVDASPTFSLQIESVLKSLIDSTAAKADLLFHLRELTFSENSMATNERGSCLLRAAIYVRLAKGTYQRLKTLDTIVVVNKKADVTRGLLKTTGNTIRNFIAGNLLQKPSDTTIFSTADIKFIEQKEKASLPVYTQNTLSDGIYKTYQSFAHQLPDKPVEVQLEFDIIRSVKTLDAKGAFVKAAPSDYFGFVYKGKSYIATENGYQLLEKRKDDFYFQVKGKRPVSYNHLSKAQSNLGLLGGIMATNELGIYEMRMDHLTGFPVMVKLIERR